MVVVSAVTKDFSDRHLFSDRPSVANIVYLATNHNSFFLFYNSFFSLLQFSDQ
jgi:hypothetical protein